MPRVRWQFSLRAMLLLVALASLGSYYLALPSLNVEELRRSLMAGDYDGLDELSAQEGAKSPFPRTHWTKEPIRGDEWHVSVQPLTWRDLVEGQRDASVSAFIYLKSIAIDFHVMVRVTPFGAELLPD
jgi:hypothetical protein